MSEVKNAVVGMNSQFRHWRSKDQWTWKQSNRNYPKWNAKRKKSLFFLIKRALVLISPKRVKGRNNDKKLSTFDTNRKR